MAAMAPMAAIATLATMATIAPAATMAAIARLSAMATMLHCYDGYDPRTAAILDESVRIAAVIFVRYERVFLFRSLRANGENTRAGIKTNN